MAFYVEILRDHYTRYKKEKGFTQAEFCKYLGINTSTFSLILNGKRDFPLSKVEDVCAKLEITEFERSKFMESLLEAKVTNEIEIPKKVQREVTLNEDDSYELISDLEMSAAFCLIKIEGDNISDEKLSSRLNISVERAKYILNKLLSWGLSQKEIEADQYLLRLTTSEDRRSEALQKCHSDSLNLGKEKLKTIEILKRDFSSVTLPANTQKLDQAKKLIRQFRRDMHNLLEDGCEDEVYYLGVQLYPLTQRGAAVEPLN